MIVFKTLTIQNFLSYGNDSTTIDLNCDAPTLITGVNYDASVNGELDSNGCGKSSILNALSYALYNKTISINEKLDSLINNINKKDMLVILTFSKGGQDFRISRYRKNKAMGGEGVLIEKKKGKTWKDITSTKPEIQIAEEVLQIPYTVFNRIIGYAAGEEPFLKMGLPKQREVIDELFEYTELTKRAVVLKDTLKGLKKDLEYAIESDDQIRQEAERHKEQLAQVENKHSTWISSHKEKIDDLNKKIKTLSNIDFDSEERRFSEIESINSTIKKLISNKETLESKIKNTKDEIEKFNNYDNAKEQKIKELKEKIKKLEISEFNKEKESKKIIKNEELESQIKNTEGKIHDANDFIRDIDTKIDKFSKELSHLEDAKCPYCLQKYEDAKSKISSINKNIKDLKDEKQTLEERIVSLRDSLTKSEEEKSQLEESIIFESLVEITNYENKIENFKDSLNELRESENPYEDKSDSLAKFEKELGEITSDIKYHKDSLSSYPESVFDTLSDLYSTKSTLEQLNIKLEEMKEEENPYTDILNDLKKYTPKEGKSDEIDEIKRDIKHVEFLIKLLTKKDSYLRKALMDKYLPLLNKRLHHYLNVMSLPHKVFFKPDLSTEISQFGQSIPYGNLSAGQRARINIALSLAFRDVLQSKHNFINLFVLDECLDVGLSNVGVKKTVRAIKEVAKINKLSMFVISHRDEAKDSFPKKLEIELKNGFSTIKSP